MIISYTPEYKNDVISLAEKNPANEINHELYMFNLFGELFPETAFIYTEGGVAAGFIGCIPSFSSSNLLVYALFINRAFGFRKIGITLIQNAVLYAYKNKLSSLSFLINSCNRKNYVLFVSVAKKLGKTVKPKQTYSDSAYLEVEYYINLKNKTE